MTKTALVTGAGRRFGFEVAKALIEDGYKEIGRASCRERV